MRIDTLAVRLRPRSAMEAADLGVRLCQNSARDVYLCYAMVALPVMALSLASSEIAPWIPGTAIWWAKPWLDRTILFVLSRAAFGQTTRPRDVWRAQRQVWWNQLLFTWTVRRLSPWRALTQPVYQLEGLSVWTARSRVRQIRRRNAIPAFMVMSVFSLCEWGLIIAMFSLTFWLSPTGQGIDLTLLFSGEAPAWFQLQMAGIYAVVVFFLEPFYVASGFGMYLNRRADLEAWDIEQEFRRAFAH